MKTLLVIGATSAIAQECVRLWLRDFEKLVLVGRDPVRLRRLKEELAAACPALIVCRALDFASESDLDAFFAQLDPADRLDTVLIAQGVYSDNDACLKDLERLRREVYLTALSPTVFLERVLSRVGGACPCRIGVIGSVAGDRGRAANYVYGACKGFIEIYLQGVRHKLARLGSPVSVTLIKPGPVATPMTARFAGRRPQADVRRVARDIVRGVGRGAAVIYTPGFWRPVMWAARHAPMRLFRHFGA